MNTSAATGALDAGNYLLTQHPEVKFWLAAGMTEVVYNDTSVLMVFYCVVSVALAAARSYCKT